MCEPSDGTKGHVAQRLGKVQDFIDNSWLRPRSRLPRELLHRSHGICTLRELRSNGIGSNRWNRPADAVLRNGHVRSYQILRGHLCGWVRIRWP